MHSCRSVFLAITVLAAMLTQAQDKSVFAGQITDSICARAGSHDEAMRMSKDMGKSAADCTIVCVDRMNAKFVLYDAKNKKTYRLADQAQARKFAGKDVKVTGTLKKNQIEVASIEAQ